MGQSLRKSVESISCHRLEAYLDLRLAHCVYNAWWRVPRRKHALSILRKNPSTLSIRPLCYTMNQSPLIPPLLLESQASTIINNNTMGSPLYLSIQTPPQPTHHHRTPCALLLPSLPTRGRRPKVRLAIVVCRESSQSLWASCSSPHDAACVVPPLHLPLDWTTDCSRHAYSARAKIQLSTYSSPSPCVEDAATVLSSEYSFILSSTPPSPLSPPSHTHTPHRRRHLPQKWFDGQD